VVGVTHDAHHPRMGQVRITSAANRRLRDVARLRVRRDRDERGLTLVDGIREVERALGSGIEIVEAWVTERLEASSDGHELLGRLAASGVEIVPVSDDAFAKVAFGERVEGVVAVVRPPSTDLAALSLPPDPLVVVVEGIEKPGNVGAILRSADGAGVDALVAADPLTDLFNPNAIRASLGTIFTVPLATASAPAIRGWLAESSIRPIATRVDADRTYAEVDLTGPVAIVLGNESNGLSTTWDDPAVVPVRIPMLGTADSLNVSVAAAVVLYEARRQRGWRNE
jgi:TrmH family RNA methyltransferase